MAAQPLSNAQADALLDILIHHETYSEIEDFKYDRAIHEYGPPFQKDHSLKSATPVLQTLVARFLLHLPGLKDVSEDFWPSQVQPLLSALSNANLSESYDKGVIGQRRTLSTAISALLEYPTRGYFGGFQKRPLEKEDKKYDLNSPEDITKAWKDFRQELVYGDLIDELFTRTAESDQLSEHSSLVQGTHRFIILNLASIMHYTLIVSPKGPSLLALLESAHRLVPYMLIRQTLRVGNAMTMINGMVKVVLAKASIGTVTNWLGVSIGADEGMNLMQTIISTVLGWDVSKLKKRASHIETDKKGPSKQQLTSLKDYAAMSQLEQEQLRSQSKSKSESIASVILSEASLSETAHSLALEYVSLKLSIRDREQLTEVLCKRNPDILTPIARDLVSGFDPIIRGVHDAVDLSGTVSDAQAFLDDMIKLSKPQNNKVSEVSAEDFVKLLEKHQISSHRFLHQVCKNGKELVSWYKKFGEQVVSQFRTSNGENSSHSGMADKLNNLLADLSASERESILKEIDHHAKYMQHLEDSSFARFKDTLNKCRKTDYGPGVYLARWQALLDGTEITPATAEGPVRKAGDKETKEASRADVDGEKRGDATVDKAIEEEVAKAPEVGSTVKLLMSKFWELLRDWGRES